MATEVKLSDIFTFAEKKYGDYAPTDDDGNIIVRFRPLLRLSDAERDELEALTTPEEPVTVIEKDDDGNDVERTIEPDKVRPADRIKDVLRLVADNKASAEALFKQIGDRLDVLSVIQDNWMEKTQAGEADSSSS